MSKYNIIKYVYCRNVKTCQEVVGIFWGLLGFWVENATKGIGSSSLTRLNHFDFGLVGLKVAALSILLILWMSVEACWSWVAECPGCSSSDRGPQPGRSICRFCRRNSLRRGRGTIWEEMRGVNLYLLSLLEIDSGPRTLHKAPQCVRQIAIASPAKKSTSLQVPENLAKDLAKEPARSSEAQNRLLTSLNWDTDGKWKERLRTLRSYWYWKVERSRLNLSWRSASAAVLCDCVGFSVVAGCSSSGGPQPGRPVCRRSSCCRGRGTIWGQPMDVHAHSSWSSSVAANDVATFCCIFCILFFNLNSFSCKRSQRPCFHLGNLDMTIILYVLLVRGLLQLACVLVGSS